YIIAGGIAVALLIGLGAAAALGIAYLSPGREESSPTIVAAEADDLSPAADRAKTVGNLDDDDRTTVSTDGDRDARPDGIDFPRLTQEDHQPAGDGQERYFVVGNSKKYHRASCRFVTDEAREITAAQARADF